jgi:hypothetical protein
MQGLRLDAGVGRGQELLLVGVCVGVLIHEWQTGPAPLSFGALAGVAAIFLLARIESPIRQIVLLATIAAAMLANLPNPSNHEFLVGILSVGVLLDAVLHRLLRIRPRNTDVFFNRVAPVIRVLVMLAWITAAFAKLNEGFFANTTSCAVWVADAVPLMRLGYYPSFVRAGVIYGTLIAEFSIAILLICRRSRVVGVVVAWVFHTVAALAGHAAFSGLLLPLYLVFLPTEVLNNVGVQARLWLGAIWSSGTALLRHRRCAPLVSVLWIVGLALLQVLPEWWFVYARRYGATMSYLLFAAGAAALLWRSWTPGHTAPTMQHLFSWRNPMGALILLVFVASALNPYVGLKTRYSMTMYSNLETEGEHWNHFVAPSWLRVFDYQDEIMTIVSVKGDYDPSIDELIGVRIPAAEARRLLGGSDRTTIEYELDGRNILAAPVSSDPRLSPTLRQPLDTILGFRPLPVDGSCEH